MGSCSLHRLAQARVSGSGGRAGVVTSGKQMSTSAAMFDARQAAQSAPGSRTIRQVRRCSCVCALFLQAGANPAHAGHPSLAEGRPQLAAEWHPTLNGNLTSADVTLGSNKLVWWLCPPPTSCPCKGPHEWQARVYKRALEGHGCPVCSGRRPCQCNSLAACRPQLVQQQWDREANGQLQPQHLLPGSNKKVAWRCDLHQPPCLWLAAPFARTRAQRPTGCPQCPSGRKGRRPTSTQGG